GSGADFSIEHRVVRPDGTVRRLSGAGRIHRGPDGTPVRGVGISMDVTERHTLEEQFQQAQKMEAVGRLAGGVAHDFNNLLTVITGYSDMLLVSPDLKPAHRTAREEIRRSAERGGALSPQLLAFSRRQPLAARLA